MSLAMPYVSQGSLQASRTWCSRLDMLRIIPQPDRRLREVVFVSKHAEAGRLQDEGGAAPRIKSKPACRQHTQEMPARKDQYVFVDRPNASHDTVRSCADLVRSFTAGTAVAKQLPVRAS